MRRLIYTAYLLAFCSTASFAQVRDYPQADFTGALAAARLGGGLRLYGYSAAPAYNLNRHFAVEGDLTCTTSSVLGTCANLIGSFEAPADFSTSCGSGVCASMLSYMAGVRYSVRPYVGKFQPFAHALIGGSRFRSNEFRNSGWAGKFGGGLDIVTTKHAAIRIFQMDYYPSHSSVGGKDKIVFAFGVRFN